MDDGAAAPRNDSNVRRISSLARLREHLDRHVVGDQVLLDQLAHEIEIGLRRRRKCDLDLLEADVDELAEHAQLPRRVHRLDQRLVAVAQVRRQPDRRAGDRARGPARSGRSIGWNGRYFCEGTECMWNPVNKERNDRPVGTARALLGTRGGVLSARGAQQEQQAARNQGRREGANGGKEKTAHPATLAHFGAPRKACTFVRYHGGRPASAEPKRARGAAALPRRRPRFSAAFAHHPR